MNEYVNPIDNIIKYLEDERQRRINAYNSGQFCDNATIKHNIEVLTKGIIAMKKERSLYIIENSIIKK